MKSGIILDEELELNLPKDRFVNVKSTEIKPAVKEAGPRRIYLWKTANTECKSEEDPEKETPPPPVQVSTFRNWEEVGNWWGALEKDRVTPTPEIRAKAAELTKDAKTDADKLKAIYNFVATRFRYISISFGIGRYQPHSADEVLKNAYCDCNDKHTLLASMLDAVGIKAYPALINSGLKIDPEVPLPGHFDHVISVVPQGTGYHSTYSFKGGVFEAERRIVMKLRELPAARRVDYQSLQKAASDDGNVYAAFTSGTENAFVPSSNPEADKLHTQGYEATQKRDFDQAITLCRAPAFTTTTPPQSL